MHFTRHTKVNDDMELQYYKKIKKIIIDKKTRHIHNQNTQKDGLMEKGLQRTILNYIYYFMIIGDCYMSIIRMMSC
jgi:hypothetical protein